MDPLECESQEGERLKDLGVEPLFVLDRDLCGFGGLVSANAARKRVERKMHQKHNDKKGPK